MLQVSTDRVQRKAQERRRFLDAASGEEAARPRVEDLPAVVDRDGPSIELVENESAEPGTFTLGDSASAPVYSWSKWTTYGVGRNHPNR